MTSYIPTVLVIILMVVYMVGALRSSYGPVKEMPDLRLSEFAPDLTAIPNKYERHIAEKVLKEEERYRRLKGQYEVYNKQLDEWNEAVKDAYAKRMLQGNPVTTENPLTPYEMPPQPHRPYHGFYH